MGLEAKDQFVERGQVPTTQAMMLDAVQRLEHQPRSWTMDQVRSAVEESLTTILRYALERPTGPVRRAVVEVTVRTERATQYHRYAQIAVEWGQSQQPGYWGWQHRFAKNVLG